MKNLTVEITDRCPSYCRHCSTYGAWDRDDIVMSRRKFIDILEENEDFSDIRLSGGEPFMHPRIVDLVIDAAFREKKVSILSCGIYREGNDYQAIQREKIQGVKGFVDNINFSLHGSRKTHEKVICLENVFQYIDETIDRVIEAEIPFSFGFVPLRTNMHDLEGAVAYVSKKAKQQDYCFPALSLLRYVKQGGSQYSCDEQGVVEKLALTRLENKQIIKTAEGLERKYGIHIIPTCSMLEKGCTAGVGKKVISVYGDVYDCSALKWMHTRKQDIRKVVACVDRH